MKYALLCLFLGASLPTLAANDADQQFAFAENLMNSGDEAFAMLEYKRFLFDAPKHAKAPEALYRIARIQLSYVQNIAGARQTLRQIRTDYPNSETAKQAKGFEEYIEVNSDFGGEPLLLMLAARADEKASKFPEAAGRYTRIVSEFPKARLAPDAAHDLADLQVHQLGKPADARRTIQVIQQNYPKAAVLPDCEYLLAEILESEKGASAEVVAAYRAVAAKYPKEAIAATATAKALELEKQAYAVKRQFDKEFIRAYTVKQAGYKAGQTTQYVVEIEVPTDCAERDVKATLEDALVKEGEKRQAITHSVTVSGYFSYPLTAAGTVTWTPGQLPAYTIAERKNEDVIKDVFIDLLKRRR